MTQLESTGGPSVERSPLDRLLRLFGDVRSGESGTVLLMLLNLFLLLVGYYIFKTVREPLILVSPLPSWIPSGAVQKSYAAAGQALTLMAFIPLYSWFSSRVDRMKLIFGLTTFLIVNIELFYLGAQAKVPYLSVAFYIWVGIFSLTTIAQFWSFGNDIYGLATGERLFPIIAIGATAGSLAGSKVTEALFEAGVNAYSMFHIAAAILVAHLGLYWVVNRRVARRPAQAKAAAATLSGGGGFGLVFGSRYLRLLALLILLLNVVNTTGNYIVDSLLVVRADAAAAADPSLDKQAFIGMFYGSYYFYVNLMALLLQALLVSRIVKYLGVAGVVLTLPFVALGGYSLVAARSGTRPDPGGQDRRERRGLFGDEHRSPDALAAHQPGREVQGQAGDRHLLRPVRRRALGRAGVRRDDLGRPRRHRVRHGQRRPRPRVAGRGLAPPPRVPGARRQPGGPRGCRGIG